MAMIGNEIARAEIVARMAHRGQVDKSGDDYILHCKAVAEIAVQMAPITLRSHVAVTAWLHDVVEDTPLSLHDLRELGFNEISVAAVGLLTVNEEFESHDDNLRRIREDSSIAGVVADVVRRADIKHNNDPTRNTYKTPEKLAEREARKLAILDGRE